MLRECCAFGFKFALLFVVEGLDRGADLKPIDDGHVDLNHQEADRLYHGVCTGNSDVGQYVCYLGEGEVAILEKAHSFVDPESLKVPLHDLQGDVLVDDYNLTLLVRAVE